MTTGGVAEGGDVSAGGIPGDVAASVGVGVVVTGVELGAVSAGAAGVSGVTATGAVIAGDASAGAGDVFGDGEAVEPLATRGVASGVRLTR
jgi:hypothetical protein